MGLVFNERGLHDFQLPIIAQEFFNHNATIFKVFVVGDSISLVKRPSIPNVNISESNNKQCIFVQVFLDQQTVFFDSQHPLGPQLAQLKIVSEKTQEQLMEEAKEPSEQVLKQFAKAINTIFVRKRFFI